MAVCSSEQNQPLRRGGHCSKRHAPGFLWYPSRVSPSRRSWRFIESMSNGTLLNDGAISSIAYDHVRYSNQPDAWKMCRVLRVASTLGVTGVIASFGLVLSVRARNSPQPRRDPIVHLPKLSVAGQLTIFVTRARDSAWSIRSGAAGGRDGLGTGRPVCLACPRHRQPRPRAVERVPRMPRREGARLRTGHQKLSITVAEWSKKNTSSLERHQLRRFASTFKPSDSPRATHRDWQGRRELTTRRWLHP